MHFDGQPLIPFFNALGAYNLRTCPNPDMARASLDVPAHKLMQVRRYISRRFSSGKARNGRGLVCHMHLLSGDEGTKEMCIAIVLAYDMAVSIA
jgi:hypothetical protein